jgi:fluoride exporter
MNKVILVMAGGSLGALARYALAIYIAQAWGTRFPWGTLLINLSGCFLIGLAFALGQERHILSPATQLLFMTGFLGAYTTFSTYGLETANFARAGHASVALVNVLASNMGGLLLVVAGLWVGRILFRGG